MSAVNADKRKMDKRAVNKYLCWEERKHGQCEKDCQMTGEAETEGSISVSILVFIYRSLNIYINILPKYLCRYRKYQYRYVNYIYCIHMYLC